MRRLHLDWCDIYIANVQIIGIDTERSVRYYPTSATFYSATSAILIESCFRRVARGTNASIQASAGVHRSKRARILLRSFFSGVV
jgi:hypothetical protein